jgi:hypothetical protein
VIVHRGLACPGGYTATSPPESALLDELELELDAGALATYNAPTGETASATGTVTPSVIVNAGSLLPDG